MLPTVNHLPYPGTVEVVNDGDLVRVKYSVQLPEVVPGQKVIVEPHFKEWGPNPTTGDLELWTTNGLLYVDYSDLDDNEGHGAPYYNDQEIKIPLQLVIAAGGYTKYLEAIRGNELYYSGRKIGWTDKWQMFIYFMQMLTPDGMNWNAYEVNWFDVNIPSLPAIPSAEFYAAAGVPDPNAITGPVSAKPTKKGQGGKGNSGK